MASSQHLIKKQKFLGNANFLTKSNVLFLKVEINLKLK